MSTPVFAGMLYRTMRPLSPCDSYTPFAIAAKCALMALSFREALKYAGVMTNKASAPGRGSKDEMIVVQIIPTRWIWICDPLVPLEPVLVGERM